MMALASIIFKRLLILKPLMQILLKRLTPGACIGVTGKLIASQGKGQSVEIVVSEIEVYGDAESDISKPNPYPLQPKAHSLEFLREIAHLRFRTNTFGAIFRVRHTLALRYS
jgi:asparaginyl-tRNA synthetase